MGRKGLNVKRTWGGKEKIQQLIKKEKDVRVKERLQAILWRLDGISFTEIAKRLNKINDTITQWIIRWNKEGYEGLIDKPRSGRPSILSLDEEKAVIETVNKSNKITCKVLQLEIKDRFGKILSNSGMNGVLHRNNLSWKKPKKKDYRQDEHEREVYQEALKKRPKTFHQKQWYGI